MTNLEKNIVKIKLKAIIKHFKKEGHSMNKLLLSRELMLSYTTLLKIFREKDKKWTPKTKTKLTDYIKKFELQNGPLLINF